MNPLKRNLVVGVCLCLLIAGCGTPQTNQFSNVPPPPALPTPEATTLAMTNGIDPAWLKPNTNLFTLGPGDKLELEVIGDTNSLTQTMVCPDGKIYFNVLPGVD